MPKRENHNVPTDPRMYAPRLAAYAQVVARVDREMGWPRRVVTGEPGKFPVVVEQKEVRQ